MRVTSPSSNVLQVIVDDRTIATQLRAGSPDALAALSARYQGRLCRYALRLLGDRAEAEDVVQEVLLKAGQSNGPRSDGSLAGWLYAVCYRLSVDRLRMRERRGRLLSLAPRSAAGPVAVEEQAETEDEFRRVERALHALDDPYRTAITLRYLEGRDFKDIARLMGTIERTARTWVGRGLVRLRHAVGERS